MVHIQWKDRYNIGYRDIDAQHKAQHAIFVGKLLDLNQAYIRQISTCWKKHWPSSRPGTSTTS